ncbi:hypothetical protein [Paractinoplanes brasiliensis]|uniref:Uncharacterized protein n=1 Tax=Paractinoplanes brasiliensis TaxID=52695 RepID=A0A4R6JRA1_9ACTN|nr:hypothetical protein [Actinoplanes brasiliensis]TDO37175.1 hypothetical protein C8E87_0781 [Actinoplanes brasiliensis]GID32908.1 hypothetical protein Abr02nite_78910 [Actinoplanes brasiliensis]
MTNQPHIPRPTVDQEAVRTHLHAARRKPTPAAVWTAVADIPVLLAEVDRLTRLLSRTRWDFADLLAAARATLNADQDGEPDPLGYLRDAVAEHRAWNPPDDGEPAA